MKCVDCGSSKVQTRRETRRYDESGVEGITVDDVEITHCDDCGAESVGFKDILGLHRRIALELAARPERLGPKEIRFLRAYLGLSGVEFATRMGARPETVSRWEREKDPQPMGVVAERFLRLMAVVHERPVDMALSTFDGVAELDPKPVRMRLARGKRGWVRVDQAGEPAGPEKRARVRG